MDSKKHPCVDNLQPLSHVLTNLMFSRGKTFFSSFQLLWMMLKKNETEKIFHSCWHIAFVYRWTNKKRLISLLQRSLANTFSFLRYVLFFLGTKNEQIHTNIFIIHPFNFENFWVHPRSKNLSTFRKRVHTCLTN